MPKRKFPTAAQAKAKRARAAARIQKSFRSRRTKLARMAFSSSRVRKNRQLSSMLRNLGETKIVATLPVNYNAASPNIHAIHGTNKTAMYCNFVLQGTVTGWDANQTSIGGIQTVQGTAGNQHMGNYIYLKKTHITMQVEPRYTTNNPPMEFRFIVCKARQAVTPAGIVDVPQNSLFLQPNGARIGHAVTGVGAMTAFDIMNQPLNKRDWVIFKDRRFTLSSGLRQTAGGDGGYSGRYPCRKVLRFNLNHYKKTRLDSTGFPQDYDAHYLIYVFCTHVGAALDADSWAVDMRGTTTYTDI